MFFISFISFSVSNLISAVLQTSYKNTKRISPIHKRPCPNKQKNLSGQNLSLLFLVFYCCLLLFLTFALLQSVSDISIHTAHRTNLKIHRKPIAKTKRNLPCNQWLQVIHERLFNIISLLIDPLQRNRLLFICHKTYGYRRVGDTVRVILHPFNNGHMAIFSLKDTLNRHGSQQPRLQKVRTAGRLGGASLHQIQLDGTHLAANLLPDDLLQNLSRPGDIPMAEDIGPAVLPDLRYVLPVFIPDTLADGDENAAPL